VSEVRESQAVRVALPAVKPSPARSGSSTWILVTCVALVCGGVLALALGGDHHARAHETAEVAREVPLDPPRPPALAAAPSLPDGPITLATASEAISIEMYSATWCSACAHARRWLGEQGITYHEIDVDTRADAMGQLSMLNPRRTLPTFDIDGDVVVGFDSGRLSSTITGAARRHR
jgi:glutaredoxin